MWRAAPLKVAHIGINAILLRAEEDLAKLAGALGFATEKGEIEARVTRMTAAMRQQWNADIKAFRSLDLVAGQPIDAATHAGFLPLLTGAPTQAQVIAMAQEITRWRGLGCHGVPSVAPDDPAFDGKRYWRGPVWCIMNWLIADGLARHGQLAEAEAVREDTRRLLLDKGFAEYFDPLDGTPCGGFGFSWTAAAALAFAFDD
jgi:glycogen debranching enzyme